MSAEVRDRDGNQSRTCALWLCVAGFDKDQAQAAQ